MAVLEYYSELGVSRNASADEIKSAYRRLAMRWHPDRWTKATLIDRAEVAKQKFQVIQEAYSVLSDARKRTLYDAGLYNRVQDDDNDDPAEGMADFLEELFSLMEKERKTKKKTHSLVELQDMLAEMMMMNYAVSGEQGDGSSCDPSIGWSRPDGPCAKRARVGCPASVYETPAKSRCSRTVRVGGGF